MNKFVLVGQSTDCTKRARVRTQGQCTSLEDTPYVHCTLIDDGIGRHVICLKISSSRYKFLVGIASDFPIFAILFFFKTDAPE